MRESATWLVGLAIVCGTTAVFLLRREAVRAAAAATLQQQASTDLRELARLRSAFLRSISHELRTPLTNVIGYGETLQAHLAVLEPERIGHFTDRMLVNARRLERLVLDLLDLDQLNVERFESHPVPVVVRDLLDEVVAALSTEHHPVHVRSTAGVVLLDPTRTRRITHELVQNVLRHTPSGTSVLVMATASDSRLRLVVEDDGPGVDPRVSHEAFEPFIQGEGVERAASPGLGIGLSLVRRYTELVGGTVQLEEPAAGGTRVVVTLPALPALPVSLAQAQRAPRARPALVGLDVLPPMSGRLGGPLGGRERHARPMMADHRTRGPRRAPRNWDGSLAPVDRPDED